MHEIIEKHRDELVALCREYGVARLEVFGSIMTDEFDSEQSDLDFLVTYPPEYDFGPRAGRLQDLEAAIAALFDRKVDLIMESALQNKWFARESAKTRQVIYDASQIAEVA